MTTLVTGTPGSGKTTLVTYARSQDNTNFFDADDMPDLCEWRDFATGSVLGPVDEVTMISDDDWYKKHGWYWKMDRLKQFLADNPNAVVCGSAENVADCYNLFDQVILFRKTKKELLQNLKHPHRNNPLGKNTKQLTGLAEWQDYLIREAKPYSHTFIQGNDIRSAYEQVLQQTHQ